MRRHLVTKWGPPDRSVGEQVLCVLAPTRADAVKLARELLGPGTYSAREPSDDSVHVEGLDIVAGDRRWTLLTAPIDRGDGLFVAAARRHSDGVVMKISMTSAWALAWHMANPGNG